MRASSMSLDELVLQRVELLDRWTKAIRHDLGNVLYPSRALLAGAADEGGRAGELAERVCDLMNMIDECRESLTNFRAPTGHDAGGAVDLKEWWRQSRHLLKAVVAGTRLNGPNVSSLALPVTPKGLTRLVLFTLVALDLQLSEPLPECITLEARQHPIGLAISVAGHHPGLTLPAVLHELAAQLECSIDLQNGSGEDSAAWVLCFSWHD
ncbi:MAG: hypothetical protein ACIAS6_04885 [Phycisphaerales bacterium JB060]